MGIGVNTALFTAVLAPKQSCSCSAGCRGCRRESFALAFPRPLQPGGELMVPSDRPRNCFGEPLSWRVSTAPSLPGRSRAGLPGLPGRLFADRRRVLSCSTFLAGQVGLLGYYTDFENHAKLRPSHRINTLAYANGPGTRPAGKRCKPLGTNALTPLAAALAYANPGRGDVSLFCRRASAVVFAIRPLINAANPARPGPGPWPLPKKQPHICQNFLLN